MNFKTFGVGATTAFALATGVTLATAPAQAAGLTGQLDFVWIADATPTSIDFYTFGGAADDSRGDVGDVLNIIATGDFSSLLFTGGVVKDLSSIPLPGGTPISQWLDFNGTAFDFKLLSFTNTSGLQYEFKGIFADGTIGTGELSTQISGTGVKSYSTTIVAAGEQIPTPALLPGLIAMGVGMLRKRKAEAVES